MESYTNPTPEDDGQGDFDKRIDEVDLTEESMKQMKKEELEATCRDIDDEELIDSRDKFDLAGVFAGIKPGRLRIDYGASLDEETPNAYHQALDKAPSMAYMQEVFPKSAKSCARKRGGRNSLII